MNPDNKRPGQENYLYKDMKCCLYSCSVHDCPETQCVLDFPGGLTAYLRYQKVRKIFTASNDINEAAKVLGIDPSNARRRFKWFKSLT